MNELSFTLCISYTMPLMPDPGNMAWVDKKYEPYECIDR